MTVVLGKTTVRADYLQKCLDKGGNLWFGIFDRERKPVKGDYFNLGVRIQPAVDKEGNQIPGEFWVYIVSGQGWEWRDFAPQMNKKKPEEKPAEVERGSVTV